MVLAPMTTLIPALEESSSKLESYEATNGWGESLAYEVIEYDGIDWDVMPTRGVNTWIGNAISSFSDSVDDLDIAIGPDQVVKTCGYNADTQDLGCGVGDQTLGAARRTIDVAIIGRDLDAPELALLGLGRG